MPPFHRRSVELYLLTTYAQLKHKLGRRPHEETGVGAFVAPYNAQIEQKEEEEVADGFSGAVFDADVETLTRPIWEKVKTRVSPLEWRLQAPLIASINALKRQKN